MTVLFSVNTEKVRLRRESFPEVYGEPEDAEQPGLRQTVGEPCQGRVGAASGAAAGAAPGEAPGTPKSHSLHPDGMRLRGGAANGGAAPGEKGIKSWTKTPGVMQGRGAQGQPPAALSANCI